MNSEQDPQPEKMPLTVAHDRNRHRFEVQLAGGESAYLSYIKDGGRIIMNHTYVPEKYRGRGIAEALARTALDEARKQQWQVVPHCSYIASFIMRNPEYADLAISC